MRFETTLLVGYPLLIAASGLWWRVGLVWITTFMAMLAYSWLYIDAASCGGTAISSGSRARTCSTPTSSWPGCS